MRKGFIYLGVFFSLLFSVSAITTVVLEEPNNENLGDARVQEGATETNYGSTNTAVVCQNTNRAYMMFALNESIIPAGSIVYDAVFHAYTKSVELTWDDHIYEVNSTWGEINITWNNQPCGTTFSDASKCNLTSSGGNTVNSVDTWYQWNVTGMVQRAVIQGRGNISMVLKKPSEGGTNYCHSYHSKEDVTETDKRLYLNVTHGPADTSPPEITFYNMSSSGGCTSWNTNKNDACNTSDTTPTIALTTNTQSLCRIGVSDWNYTTMGSSRNCTGQETTSHICTLTIQDELTQEDSNLYIGCKNAFGDENATSTSGALKISLNSTLLISATQAIENGIQNALVSGYSIFSNQQVYARNSANSQTVGVFDRVAKKLNKVWAFNYLDDGETAISVFNITPVFYALEIQNLSPTTITATVEQLINNTK